jgi:hypothetical protein
MSIYLIGDGILDNYKYLDDKESDLCKEILNLGYSVHNYAKEEMKVIDVINGHKIDEKQAKSRNYQIDKDYKLHPLKLIQHHSKRPTSTHNVTHDNIAVISIGGNDVNERFFNILLGIDYFMGAILTPEFQANYEKIIESVSESCSKILLISMYLPYLGQGSSYAKYVSYASSIMKKWNDFIYSLAKKRNIPVLDLNKTIDNQNRTHYSSIDDTRLNNISSKCIAKCIKYIHKNYQGYHIYYSTNCNGSKIYRTK